MTAQCKTVAILYPGEMGSALAALLSVGGARVVTVLSDRSGKTVDRCKAAGIVVLPTLDAVVSAADFVISLVTPSAALEVAESYRRMAHLAPASAVYVDANSIGPESVQIMASHFDEAGVGFVDGAINGLAKNLATSATFFLSGPRARDVSDLIGKSMRVSVLGEEPGHAAAMKMLLSGVSKGLCALFIETALTAQNRGLLPDLMEACSRIYPGVMAIVDRMLPTYREHASRRAEEMAQAVEMMRAADTEPRVMSAVLQLHERLAEVNFDRATTAQLTVASLIAQLAESDATDADRARPPHFAGSARTTKII